MKNILRAIALLAVITFLFASCKSHEKCPAYGEMSKPKVHHTIQG